MSCGASGPSEITSATFCGSPSNVELTPFWNRISSYGSLPSTGVITRRRFAFGFFTEGNDTFQQQGLPALSDDALRTDPQRAANTPGDILGTASSCGGHAPVTRTICTPSSAQSLYPAGSTAQAYRYPGDQNVVPEHQRFSAPDADLYAGTTADPEPPARQTGQFVV